MIRNSLAKHNGIYQDRTNQPHQRPPLGGSEPFSRASQRHVGHLKPSISYTVAVR